MLKVVINKKSGVGLLIVFGLAAADVKEIQDGKVLFFHLSEIIPPDMDTLPPEILFETLNNAEVSILYGDTDEVIRTQLEEQGLKIP